MHKSNACATVKHEEVDQRDRHKGFSFNSTNKLECRSIKKTYILCRIKSKKKSCIKRNVDFRKVTPVSVTWLRHFIDIVFEFIQNTTHS